ncbi:hypothetical protein [Helicobacter bilis]|uniref:hypothetical protein n=1 Tax=Helicobacter bilis TaxID=37372 RepID=UPI0026F0D1FD|nr:hypothetical protein [Helicobacter bilis]MCI7410099.1 hypothetical protein [Helicobacter bilis]MDD7296918.1 hypothetical protein [Helicobacter bilis]MDY4400941.1 hypothetical protein [Helicobacter bilis]
MATEYVEQFVRCNSFLEEKEINLADLKQGVNIISAIPENHICMGIDIEVLEAGTGTLDVGVKGDSNRFIGGVSLTAVKNNASSVRLSSKGRLYPIVLDVKAAQTKGKIVFRMQMFGNEVRMKDYTLSV